VAIPIFKEVLISFVALVSLANQKNEVLQTALHCNNYVNVILSQTFVMQPSNAASLAPQGMMRIVM
jgi:sugar (pentulose or hexulose) kinase